MIEAIERDNKRRKERRENPRDAGGRDGGRSFGGTKQDCGYLPITSWPVTAVFK